MSILITGFGAFGEFEDNPSATLAQQSGRPNRVLEVSYQAVDEFIETVDPTSFKTLLMIGVAGGRDRITPELFARNFSGHVHDVRGVEHHGFIEEAAPMLLAGTLWSAGQVADWTTSMRVRASLNAGSYLCNYIYYRALRRFEAKHIGFLHIPDVKQFAIEDQRAVLNRLLTDLNA